MQAIIKELPKTGLCRVWNQPTGAAYRDGDLIRYGLKGSADISGILIDGRRIEIEVKTGNAKQQDNQRAFMSMILAMNGIYFVARSVEDALIQLNKAATTGSKL